MTSAPFAAMDAGLDRLLRLARALPPLDPIARGLSSHRRREVKALASQLAPRLASLAPDVASGEPAATARFDAIVARAVEALRGSRPTSAPEALLAGIDRVLYENRDELLDDPAFPQDQRRHVLATLDRFNAQVGAYDRWIQVLAADLAPRPDGRPLRIHDLAAGHGGFALALKAQLGQRAEIIASDISDEYLDIGRAHAKESGLEVMFMQQDATQLASLRGDVDVFLCTQSLHHFPPGMVSRMLGEAARAARRSVCFIDAERGIVPLALVTPVMAAIGRAWPVVHDTVASLRRMYVEEELLLIASLAPLLPPAAQLSSGRFGAGYAHVHIKLA